MSAYTVEECKPKRIGADVDALSDLVASASRIGVGIVEHAGELDQIRAAATAQLSAMRQVETLAEQIVEANDSVRDGITSVSAACDAAEAQVACSTGDLRRTGEQTREIASWVRRVGGQMESVGERLDSVQGNNKDIAAIARQVNILAINAKIEAARAGDAGRGFSVVADAINDLSQQTTRAAQGISEAIVALAEMISRFRDQAEAVAEQAEAVLEGASRADRALAEIAEGAARSARSAEIVASEADRVASTVAGFKPSFQGIVAASTETDERIAASHERVEAFIDLSETIVQGSVALGGQGDDMRFITHVQASAADIGGAFESALSEGRIEERDLFGNAYEPVPGSDPQQYVAPFTALTDELLPPIQEAALEIDPLVVFCAAVDRNGYLPTHNRKFSQRQGSDPVWNAANCRNRRIFDDRVGLKAGRNRMPFLVQIYRRDMGGGDFVMMKDASAPIVVHGRHWGGLRLAYRS